MRMDDKKDLLEGLLNDEDNVGDDIPERQLKILEAAVQVFSEKGFEGSRTSDIAKAADVAEGTIFRYYKTKKDLLIGLMFPLATKFFRPLILKSVEHILKNEKDMPIEKVLKEIFLDRVKLARKNMPLVKTMMIESLYHPELLEPLQEKLMPDVVKFIDSMAVQNIKDGKFREIDPRLFTRTIMSLLAGYIALTTLYPGVFGAESDEDEVKKIVDILLNGVIKRGSEGNA
jgi:AcrR family transcriptional regulator